MICDQKKTGKLTAAQFYAFFHMTKLLIANKNQSAPNSLPQCLQETEILRIMNNNNDNGNPWNSFSSFFEDSTNNNSASITSNSNLFDTIETLNISNTSPNAASYRTRSDSIDSVHDWGDLSNWE